MKPRRSRGTRPPPGLPTTPMLMIRREQMQALGAQMERSFVERLSGAVAALFAPAADQSVAAQPPAQADRALVGQAVQRAAQFGIDREKDIAAFVVLFIATREAERAGRAFLDWTRPIITSDAIAGPAKMALIEHRLRAAADADSARVSGLIRRVQGGA